MRNRGEPPDGAGVLYFRAAQTIIEGQRIVGVLEPQQGIQAPEHNIYVGLGRLVINLSNVAWVVVLGYSLSGFRF